MSTALHATLDTIFSKINGYTIQNNHFEHVTEALSPYKSEHMEALRSWLPGVEACLERDRDVQRAYSLILVTMGHLAMTHGEELPSWFLEYLPGAATLKHRVPEKALKVFDKLGDQGLIDAIETTYAHDPFSRDTANRLGLRVKDSALFEQAIVLLLEKSSPDKLAPLFIPAVDRVLPIIRDHYEEGDNATLKLILLIANAHHASDCDDIYLEALGHKVKGLRELAQLGVSGRGGAARALLERGAKARRKVVRAWCATQLDVIGDAPEEFVQNPFEQLPGEEQAAMGQRIDELYQKPDKLTQSWIEKEVSRDPVLWMHALMSLFATNPKFIHRWAIVKKLLTHEATAPHHETMWGIYLDHLARNPRIDDSHTQWHLKKHFELIPTEYEREALEHAIRGASAPMTVPMIVHYFAVRLCSPEMLATSLAHKSKQVRDAALSGAKYFPEDADASPVVALLSARKKDTRKYAAEALFVLPLEHITPHVTAIQTQLEKEKVEPVLGALQAVLARVEEA